MKRTLFAEKYFSIIGLASLLNAIGSTMPTDNDIFNHLVDMDIEIRVGNDGDDQIIRIRTYLRPTPRRSVVVSSQSTHKEKRPDIAEAS